MHYLAEGMHASISPPCRVQTHWTVCQARQTGFERALDGNRIGLELPAVIARAAVFEEQLKATWS